MTEKEIWMQKLMKYVEEMQKEWINICRPRFQEYYLLEMMLISKHYWLVKRLVENNKVKELRPIEEERIYTQEELLLMELAISDTPIDDLISYLK